MREQVSTSPRFLGEVRKLETKKRGKSVCKVERLGIFIFSIDDYEDAAVEELNKDNF